MNYKTYKQYDFLLIAIKKAIILFSIMLYPTLILKMVGYVTDQPVTNVIEGQIPFLSLVLIGATITQLLFLKKRFSSIAVFTYYVFPLTLIGFISLKMLLIQLHHIQTKGGSNVQDVIILIISFLYFLLANTSIELNKAANDGTAQIIKYSIYIKTPIFFVRILNAKNQLLRKVLYFILRFTFYIGGAILFTLLTSKYFPFEKTIPNYLTVFGVMITVLSIGSELFIKIMKSNDK